MPQNTSQMQPEGTMSLSNKLEPMGSEIYGFWTPEKEDLLYTPEPVEARLMLSCSEAAFEKWEPRVGVWVQTKTELG